MLQHAKFYSKTLRNPQCYLIRNRFRCSR